MPQFILKIDLGNEGMNTAYDVRDALETVREKIDRHSYPFSFAQLEINKFSPQDIRDINGNVVGHYEVIP